MELTEEQLIKIIESPNNKDLVEKGRNFESRLRLFTEPMEKSEAANEYAYKEFTNFMSRAISSEKEIRLNEFIRFPLSTNSITESLLSDIYKVFDAGNSFFSVNTVKKNGGETIQKWLKDINLTKWIEEVGKDVLRSKPNLIVVVDKDSDGKPYLIPVDNNRLIDFELSDDGYTLNYVAFGHSVKVNEAGQKEERFAIYDDVNYHVILKLDGELSVENSIPHGGDRCPARFFINQRLNSKNEINRKAPLASVLSKLEEWQYFDVYKFYTDHTSPFPVIEMVRSKCKRSDCNDGWVTEDFPIFVDGETIVKQRQKKCDVCESANHIGIGTKIIIDPQIDKDQPTAGGKFRMISNNVEHLRYLQEKLDKIETQITAKVVGIDDIVVKEAVNEKQMEGAFESKTNVLMKIKTNLDDLYVWIVQTIINLTEKGATYEVQANFGTEWYLISEDELQERLKNAIENKFPKEEIDMLYKQLIETKYKGNPEKIDKLKLINNLNPCPFDSLEIKEKKLQLGIITLEELIISEKIHTLVNKFELDNGSIVNFGSKLELKRKIETILKQFKKYIVDGTN